MKTNNKVIILVLSSNYQNDSSKNLLNQTFLMSKYVFLYIPQIKVYVYILIMFAYVCIFDKRLSVVYLQTSLTDEKEDHVC